MKNLKYIVFIFLFPVIISCKNSEESEEQVSKDSPGEIVVSQDQFSSSAMELGFLIEKDFPEVVQTTGEIDVPPENRVAISAFTGGYVKRIPLLVGDEVKKGQSLVTLENPEYIEIQQEYLEVAEQQNYLKADFERQQTLLKEKVTSEKKFLQAKSDYKKNLAMYNGLRRKLQMLNINPASVEEGRITSEITIYAPIKGSVTALDISRGMFVSPMDRIMEIIDKEHMHLELIAFENDIMKITKGQEIIFRIPEAKSESFNAEVYLVGTSIDRETRTVKVHGHLPDSLIDKFSVGMFVEADILTNQSTHFALPEEAVITQDEISYVLKLEEENEDGYIFKRQPVQVIGTSNGFIGIENQAGFTQDDRFLIKGGFRLIE
ncbi:efflux RND transporter periplasmic adaptor subunit [Salegentibacter sp. LM13S]|uniref:efflux RND transporter periplasmic adaptor subunit n=1 Tax=Salegentibacter lacus TaxID=2873599 RepID=UPI001CCBEAEB|nr:efflux RND transporter periplasmic adaptor subunit [Salegentibacter lacus]MBZ9630989.1 efflux RND transporter periplasmic adaptor subunit [Salegentibacter lacus]